MLELRCGADLCEEPVGPERSRQFRFQDLDRDQAIVTDVTRGVHPGHPAFADFTFNFIAAGERLVIRPDGTPIRDAVALASVPFPTEERSFDGDTRLHPRVALDGVERSGAELVDAVAAMVASRRGLFMLTLPKAHLGPRAF